MKPEFDYKTDAIQLSGEPLPAKLTLQFRSLSVDAPIDANCVQPERRGWLAMLDFYQLTESGVLEFDIPATHRLWQVSPMPFLGYLWQITQIEQGGNVVGDFSITIQQGRSRNKGIINTVDIPVYTGIAVQNIDVSVPTIGKAIQDLQTGTAQGILYTDDNTAQVPRWVDLSVIESTADPATGSDIDWAVPTDVASYSQPLQQQVADVPRYDDDRGLSKGYEYQYQIPKWYDIQN
jgi:hypothetical protein